MPLHAPEEQDIFSTTLEEALGWCLIWLMVKGPQVTGNMSWASGCFWSG
jgi:hypothetical protein